MRFEHHMQFMQHIKEKLDDTCIHTIHTHAHNKHVESLLVLRV